MPSFLKALLAAAPALALSACTLFVPRSEFDEVANRFDKFSAQTAQKNDMQALLYEEIVKQNKSLAEKMVQTEALTGALESSVRRLEDLVRTLQAGIDALQKGAPPAAGSPAEPAKTQIKLEDVLREIEVVLGELRNGKIRTADASTRLKPHSTHAAPKVLSEIREHFASIEYTQQLEAILAAMPPADLKVPLQGALQQRAARESAVRVVGAAGDRELSRLLEPLAGDPDEDFRLALGDALAKCRNAAGVPLLVGGLKSKESASRLIAIASLKKLNRGQDLGFRASAPADANAGPVKAWEEWVEKFGKAVFE
jgi:hypothetical protein